MSIRKKGIFKGGLRYFSQMFEEEEEKEIQIGMPTDVKHVAHIGWDGPSASAPTWMNEFKSAPLEGSADAQCNRATDDVKWVSEDKGLKAHAASSGGPGLPRSSRRTASAESLGSGDSMDRSPTSQHATKSKESKGSRRKKEKSRQKVEAANDEAASQDLPKIPKKSRRKKSKDLDSVRESGGKATSKRGTRNGSLFGAEDGAETLEEE